MDDHYTPADRQLTARIVAIRKMAPQGLLLSGRLRFLGKALAGTSWIGEWRTKPEVWAVFVATFDCFGL